MRKNVRPILIRASSRSGTAREPTAVRKGIRALLSQGLRTWATFFRPAKRGWCMARITSGSLHLNRAWTKKNHAQARLRSGLVILSLCGHAAEGHEFVTREQRVMSRHGPARRYPCHKGFVKTSASAEVGVLKLLSLMRHE